MATSSITPVLPAYGDASIVDVGERLITRDFGGDDLIPAVVEGASTIILLVLDGLGWRSMQHHAAELKILSALEGGPITSVAPTTTSTALTSIATGLTPAMHGVVGYRMRVPTGVLNVLRWTVPDQRPPDPVEIQHKAAFGDRWIPVSTRAEFSETGFTLAHLRGADLQGWHTISGLVEQCRRLAERGVPFAYTYYDGIDKVAHARGLHDGFFAAELAFADGLVDQILDALPSEAALVVTADHGQVEIGPTGWVTLDPAVAEHVEVCAGDGRFRYLYAHRGRVEALVDACTDHYGEVAWVVTREQAIDDHWFGPKAPTSEIRARIGDVILASQTNVAFVDPLLLGERGLIAGHGSLTPEEMLVPLVAGRGRR